MSRKSPSKSKRLAKADLNFVSQQAFEQVLDELKTLRSRNVKPYVMQVDKDTAIFQLHYIRDSNTTAEVSGRLKRWAGNMTHIYCDGRVFHERNWRAKLWRWVIDWQGFLVLWLLFFSFMISQSTASDSPVMLVILSFIISMVIFGLFHFARSFLIILGQAIIPKTIRFQNPHASKPEAKDRERLFHAITSIIRDDDLSKKAIERLETKPLTEAEEALLVAQITLQANQQNL